MESKEALGWLKLNTSAARFHVLKGNIQLYEIIKNDLDKLDGVYDAVEQALQEELTFHLGKVDYDTLNIIKTGVLRRIKRYLEK